MFTAHCSLILCQNRHWNDTHKLAEGRPLMLGGVHVSPVTGRRGAISDATLFPRNHRCSAWPLCEATFGMHFPIAIAMERREQSSILSRVVWLAHRGLRVINVDATIMLERHSSGLSVVNAREYHGVLV